jgi:ABC-type protease/lipase transport system fused ATPase/permease subunit
MQAKGEKFTYLQEKLSEQNPGQYNYSPLFYLKDLENVKTFLCLRTCTVHFQQPYLVFKHQQIYLECVIFLLIDGRTAADTFIVP